MSIYYRLVLILMSYSVYTGNGIITFTCIGFLSTL